jgi:methionyl-tRNA formyltransferase
VQLSLELFEDEVKAGLLWEELAPAARRAVVSTLARLMAKSIEEKEGRHDQATTE